MTDRVIASEDVLDVLGCEIGARPAGAPGPDELLPWLRVVERTAGTLTLTLAPEAATMVEAFAAAERRCCGGIGWEVEPAADAVRLRVRATDAQTNALAGVFSMGAPSA